MAENANFSKQYKDPRWQRLRLQVMQSADFTCQHCGAKHKPLHIHHTRYQGKVWEVNPIFLRCFCEDCHEEWHNCKESIFANIEFFSLEQLILLSEKAAQMGEE